MQLRQFLWIFLRCAHITVNGMNRNVRTVCSILWNCYDFFFSYHIIYLPGNFCKSSGQFILFEQYFLFSVSLCSIICCFFCLCIVSCCFIFCIICCFCISIVCCCFIRCSKRIDCCFCMLYIEIFYSFNSSKTCDLTVNTVEITGCLKLRFPGIGLLLPAASVSEVCSM